MGEIDLSINNLHITPMARYSMIELYHSPYQPYSLYRNSKNIQEILLQHSDGKTIGKVAGATDQHAINTSPGPDCIEHSAHGKDM